MFNCIIILCIYLLQRSFVRGPLHIFRHGERLFDYVDASFVFAEFEGLAWLADLIDIRLTDIHLIMKLSKFNSIQSCFSDLHVFRSLSYFHFCNAFH